MKCNKILILFLGILLLNFVSSAVYFNESDGEYGKYVIDTWVPDWLGGEGTSEIKLIQNTDQCLIDCSFTLEGTNEQPVNLIDDIKFVNKEGKNVKDNLKEITFYLGKYEEIEKLNYSKPIYSTKEVCNEINLNKTNSSNFTETCYYPVVDYETYNVDELVWTEYNGEQVEGYFQLKADAKKDTISMDWIITFRGKELAEYEWWNSDWKYKRQINLTADAGEFSYLSEINYSENMQEDYDDLRFINNAEDTEFNYTIQTYNSTRAVVRIYSQGENSFWLYYGNSEASSTSQTAGAFHFNPIAGYYMDGNANDFMNSYNGTVNGATISQTGKIGKSYLFVQNGDGSDKITTSYSIPQGQRFTVNAWINPNLVNVAISGTYTSVNTGRDGFFMRVDGEGDGLAVGIEYDNSVFTGINYNHGTSILNEWNFVTFVYDSNRIYLYFNGEIVGNESTSITNLRHDNTFTIGNDRIEGGGFPLSFNGTMDEVSIYNRALTPEEISLLYNYTSPTFTIGEEQIEKGFISIDYVTPPTPENNSNLSVNYIPVEIEINYTNATLDNITYNFYKGGELNQSYYFTNETLFVNHTGCQCDNWAFNVTACYTEQNKDTSNCTTTETRYLIIDSQPPVINITSPLTTYDYLYDNYTLDLNWSVEDEAGHLDSCWYEYNGVENLLPRKATQVNNTDIWVDGTNWVLAKQFLIDGYIVNVTSQGCSYGEYSNNIKLEINYTNGSSINEEHPFTITNKCNIYSLVNPNELERVETVNIYVKEIQTGGSVISGNTTVYYYDSCLLNTTQINYIPNVNNLTFYANDTFGNLGSEFRGWSIGVLEDNVIYNEETTEGSYETFILELTKDSSIQIQSATLHYDVQNVSSQIFIDGNDMEIRSNLLIPSVELNTNNTFYWTLNLVGGGTINTRNFTQEVNNILIGNCSTYSNSLINLLLKDEGTKNSINGTIQTNLEILNNLNYGLAYEFIGENTNVNTVNLCSNINLTETDFLLNAEIRYFAENHSSEFYHIQRANLTDYPVNLSLYTLAEEDTTIFTVLYRNQQLIGVEGAILQLQRKYVDEGIFEIVEAPLTSSESKAVLHIDTDTNKYQIVVVKNGEVLGLFENLVFVCQSELTGECVLNLFETISAPELPTLTEMTDFTYSILTNDTSQEVQVLFSVPSGTPNEVQVVLVQNDILGSSTICNETLISSSGSIICDYNKSIQDSTLELKIYNSDNLVAQKGYVVSDNILESFGGVNYIILIIFVISLAFMAISSPEWIIINAVIALLIGGLTWLVRGLDFVVGIGGLIWLVVAAIILVSKISKQEDQ